MGGVVDVLGSALNGGRDREALALIGRRKTYSWADLDRAVEERAAELSSQGFAEGRVAPVTLAPDDDGIVTLLALWRIGATPAPLNPRMTETERDHAIAFLDGRDGEGAQSILWTSGSTGAPRAVSFSPEAMRAHVDAATARLTLTPNTDLWLASLALAHVGGLMLVFRAVLTRSRLVAFGALGSEELSQVVEGRGQLMGRSVPITHLSLVPTQLHHLLGATDGRPPPASLRCVLLGGAHTPQLLLERARVSGWPVALTYGMTEMCSQVATATPSQVVEKPGSVGRPLEGVEVRISHGGEVCLRGPTQATAYLDGTSLTDPDGWYHTGDLGRVDGDGDLWITGRRNDRIVTGGVNVDAVEVEEVLQAHPAVSDVSVAGVADDVWGETVAACVVPVEGEFDLDEVEAWLRERLTGAKRPRRWLLVPALPTTNNGKRDRSAVRALLADAAAR